MRPPRGIENMPSIPRRGATFHRGTCSAARLPGRRREVQKSGDGMRESRRILQTVGDFCAQLEGAPFLGAKFLSFALIVAGGRRVFSLFFMFASGKNIGVLLN